MQPKSIQEMEPGYKFCSEPKVISEKDIKLYDEIRGISGPMHESDEYAQKVGFKQRIVSSGLIFSIVNALAGDALIIKDAVAFLGMQDLRFIAPLYPDEAFFLEGELVGKRASKSRDAFIFTYKWEAKKLDGTIVASGVSSEMAVN